MPASRHSGSFGALTLAVACGVLLAGCRSDEAVPAPSVPGTTAGPVGTANPVAVLRGWDRSRSRAYAAGDAAALRRLYVPGSAAGAADVELLRSYLRRGLHVEGLRVQLLAVDVLHRDDGRLELRVTDRVASAVAVGEQGRRVLPRDRASTRVVELLRSAEGTWQVASVSSAGPPRRAARSPWAARR